MFFIFSVIHDLRVDEKMGQIEGWSQIRKSKNGSTWKNNHSGRMIWLNDTGNGYTVYTGSGTTEIFDTKEKAKKYVIFLMKNNPRG